MKKLLAVFVLFLTLCGCNSTEKTLEPAMELRQKLQSAQTCSFQACITADYSDSLYTFRLACETDARGDMTFTVVKPDSISDVSGKITGKSGALIFDDKVLGFAPIADDYITPVMAPWVMINNLKSGYITAVGVAGEYTLITVNDSYDSDALELEVWAEEDGRVVRCEILYRGRRCLTIDVEDFQIQ